MHTNYTNTVNERRAAPVSPRDMAIFQAKAIERRSLRDVGQEFGLSHERIRQIVNTVEKHLLTDMKEEMHAHRVRHTFRLEQIGIEAMAAWERSKSNIEIIKSTENKNGDKVTERTIKSQIGDPRFLDVARAAMLDIRKMWGINEGPNDNDSLNQEQDKGPIVQMVFMDAIGPDSKIRYPKVNKADPVTGELPPLPDGAIVLD